MSNCVIMACGYILYLCTWQKLKNADDVIVDTMSVVGSLSIIYCKLVGPVIDGWCLLAANQMHRLSQNNWYDGISVSMK